MSIVIQTKTIKPAKMRIDEIRLELLNELRRQGKRLKEEYAKTTATWTHQPKFEQIVSLKGGEATVLVGTDDKIYGYVDEGTRPHPIFAGIYTGKSTKRALLFSGTFTSKTQPNIIGSGVGARGKRNILRPYVQHPGNKARNFTKIIQKNFRNIFKDAMLKAMKVGADKAQAKAT